MRRLQLRRDQILSYRRVDTQLVAAQDRPVSTEYDRFAYLVQLSAALAQPWTGVVLSGAATVEALRSNLSALEAAPYGHETDRRLLPLREEREHYWSERANLPWA
jgi:aryl-alcohol dehydrogenase-like predicted oxidoreductase